MHGISQKTNKSENNIIYHTHVVKIQLLQTFLNDFLRNIKLLYTF